MRRLCLFAAGLIAAAACGFNPSSEPDPDADASTGDAPPPTLDEDITLAPGWSVGIWRDFSSEFTFVPLLYDDGIGTYSSAPIGLHLLTGSFGDGLGVLTTHSLIRISAAGVYSEELYFRATPSGPDAMWDATFCGTAITVTDSLCIAATSADDGDGLFVVDGSGQMGLFDIDNNVSSVAYDQKGAFDGLGGERVYQSLNAGVFLVNNPAGAAVIADATSSMRVLPDGDLLVVAGQANQRTLSRVASISHNLSSVETKPPLATPINFQRDDPFSVVRGDTDRIPGDIHAVVNANELVAFVGAEREVLASTAAADGWQWVAALAPPPGHLLAGADPVIYLLESNRSLDRDRILQLTYTP